MFSGFNYSHFKILQNNRNEEEDREQKWRDPSSPLTPLIASFTNIQITSQDQNYFKSFFSTTLKITPKYKIPKKYFQSPIHDNHQLYSL